MHTKGAKDGKGKTPVAAFKAALVALDNEYADLHNQFKVCLPRRWPCEKTCLSLGMTVLLKLRPLKFAWAQLATAGMEGDMDDHDAAQGAGLPQAPRPMTY